MKKRGCLSNLIFKINILAVLLLACTLLVPYISPLEYYNISLASLAVPVLILINILFAVYWLFTLWRSMIPSAIVLLLAYFQFGPFIKFGSSPVETTYRNNVQIYTQNVRLFNAYEAEVDEEEVARSFESTINEHNPDVIVLQEYYEPHKVNFSNYPYQYIHFKKDHKLGHAVFSKYEIVSKGAFDFEGTSNNSIYADILKDGDIIRIYNIHLQSMGILPDVTYLQEGDTDRIRYRMANTFKAQASQVEKILQHSKSAPHPVIYAGDFNNTQFSYIYKQLADGNKDAFVEMGSGLGTTFWFDFYPMRIDYVLCPEQFDVTSFSIPKPSTSDHYPVLTSFDF